MLSSLKTERKKIFFPFTFIWLNFIKLMLKMFSTNPPFAWGHFFQNYPQFQN